MLVTISPELLKSGLRPVVVHWTASAEEPGAGSAWLKDAMLAAVKDAIQPDRPADAAVARCKDALRVLGRNPNRYRISSDALLRRARKDGELPSISPAVDCNNLISVSTGWPVGCYDAASLRGDVEFAIGKDGEHMDTLGKGRMDISGLPVLSDASGPFGSPVSDSVRTSVNGSCPSVWYAVYAFEPADREALVRVALWGCRIAGLRISEGPQTAELEERRRKPAL